MKRIFSILLATAFMLASFSVWAQAQSKPLELKYADWNPPVSAVAMVHQKMLDMIAEKSQGRIKIVPYFGEGLLKMPEVYRGVQSGVADIAYWAVGGIGSPEKLSTLVRMPFNGISTMEMGTAITEKFFRMSPELASEYKGLEVLGFRMMPIYQMHTVKKPVRAPADARGMKVIASAGWADYAKVVNAAPVSLGIGDWYLSLERGLVEGQWVHFPVAYIFKTLDVFKYHTMINSSSTPDCFIINKAVWDSLSPDLQKIVREAVQWEIAEILKVDGGEEAKAIDYAKKRGNTFHYPDAEELKLWNESARPMHEAWVAKYEKEGLPAKKLYERWNQLIREYKK
ncbi:MAG: TRAP transporter substrate-binding protein DctP [Thermodesulfobacteriota bacterium]